MAQGNIEEIRKALRSVMPQVVAAIDGSSQSSSIWSYIRSTIKTATNLPTPEQAVGQLTKYGLLPGIAMQIYNYYKDAARRGRTPDVEHGGSAGWRGGGRRKYKRKKSSKKKKKKKSKRKKSKTRRQRR
jgi:hypothetical protein